MFVSSKADQWRHPWLVGLALGLQLMATTTLAVDALFSEQRADWPVRLALLAGLAASVVCQYVGMRRPIRSRPTKAEPAGSAGGGTEQARR